MARTESYVHVPAPKNGLPSNYPAFLVSDAGQALLSRKKGEENDSYSCLGSQPGYLFKGLYPLMFEFNDMLVTGLPKHYMSVKVLTIQG